MFHVKLGRGRELAPGVWGPQRSARRFHVTPSTGRHFARCRVSCARNPGEQSCGAGRGRPRPGDVRAWCRRRGLIQTNPPAGHCAATGQRGACGARLVHGDSSADPVRCPAMLPVPSERSSERKGRRSCAGSATCWSLPRTGRHAPHGPPGFAVDISAVVSRETTRTSRRCRGYRPHQRHPAPS